MLITYLKARAGTNSKPSVKFFDIKTKFFLKSDSKSENLPEDEDDSWLDEPNLDTFPLETSLYEQQCHYRGPVMDHHLSPLEIGRGGEGWAVEDSTGAQAHPGKASKVVFRQPKCSGAE
jgi:hypothetical protein